MDFRILFSLLMVVIAGIKTASGFDVGQCPISAPCMQCLSSGSPVVQRCQQLYFLATETVSCSLLASSLYGTQKELHHNPLRPRNRRPSLL